MTVRTKVIGRQQTDHGLYDPGQSYGKKYQVELYGCVWESKHDNNNTAPATLDTSTGTITPNTTDWKKVTGSYNQWLIDNGYQKWDASNVKDGNDTQHAINENVARQLATVDERIATEGAQHYLKSETYTKSEVNGMITTPDQEYVTVTATDQTTSVTDVLPATGEPDTVYRVGNWDGNQYDATVYSEYAWNESTSQYIHLRTKTQIGEVFDISAYHATGGTLATYSDLNDALNGVNGGVPQSLQRGGMSVKFVQSSDNSYVQYQLTATAFSVNAEDWAVCSNVKVVQNKKYAYALVDNNDIFILGITREGKIEYGFGIPEDVAQAIEEAIEEAIDLGNGISLNDIVRILQTNKYSFTWVDNENKELESIKDNGEKVSNLVYDFRKGFKLDGKIYRNEGDLRKDYTKSASPLMFDLTGDGSEASPYTYTDGNAGISSAIAKLTRGGLVTIPCSKYNISSSIQLTSRNVRIVGECQAFPDDPLAVRPATSGTRINLTDNTISAFIFRTNAGGEMSHLGIYGTERNGNMANKFDKNNYLYESGINLKGHVDQADFHRMSISALACGLVFDTDGMIDACIFDNLNFDGCDFGIYQPPTETWCGCCRFENIVMADMSGRAMHFSNITRFWFKDITIAGVGGGTPAQVAALDNIRTLAYFKASSSFFSSFDIFGSGSANPIAIPNWNTEYNGDCIALYIEGNYNNITTNVFSVVTDYCLYIKGNKNIIVSNNIAFGNAKGIYIEGDDNIISDNIIELLSAFNIAIYVKGNNNVVNGNLSDGQIIIDGDNNKIMNHTSKTLSAYITVSGNSNILYDINTSEVTDNGTNTIFKNF